MILLPPWLVIVGVGDEEKSIQASFIQGSKVSGFPLVPFPT